MAPATAATVPSAPRARFLTSVGVATIIVLLSIALALVTTPQLREATTNVVFRAARSNEAVNAATSRPIVPAAAAAAAAVADADTTTVTVDDLPQWSPPLGIPAASDIEDVRLARHNNVKSRIVDAQTHDPPQPPSSLAPTASISLDTAPPGDPAVLVHVDPAMATIPLSAFAHDLAWTPNQPNLDEAPYRDPKTRALNRTAVQTLVRSMFRKGWNGYLRHGFPHDDLAALTCTGRKSQGEYYLTLIDSADTLAMMGLMEPFAKTIQLITTVLPNFDLNVNVSLFETNIRILGGLVSSHLIATEKLPNYRGELLPLARDLGNRFLPAFNTRTGIPYGTVNLRYGVPPAETPIVCTACAGSLLLEMGTLSHLTRDPRYYNAAKRALVEVWNRRSYLDLLGNHVDSQSGMWTATTSGIAGAIDSLYEYLWKGFTVFHDNDLYDMFVQAYHAIEIHGTRDGWHVPVEMNTGDTGSGTFANLQCFWAGYQASFGELVKSTIMVQRMAHLSNQFAFLPELLNVRTWTLTGHSDNPLRPELVESVYFLYQAVKEPGLQEFGFELLKRFYERAQTPCGFASIAHVESLSKNDHMESFFLAESLKYLYLLFDPNNDFNTGSWIYTTEAHPVRVLAHRRPRPKWDIPRARPIPPLRPPRDHPEASPRVRWAHQVCDAREWRYVRDHLAWSNPHTGVNWVRDWPNVVPPGGIDMFRRAADAGRDRRPVAAGGMLNVTGAW
ncbi:ER degradation-enhancing alpha-mannosidase-like protein 1 [Allomyces arbusculus]|nr:ER degradation-enhancing alpha-mannosidase-like protein 1 [Allomyces arbusculus]